MALATGSLALATGSLALATGSLAAEKPEASALPLTRKADSLFFKRCPGKPST
jgi:hypothetical protein